MDFLQVPTSKFSFDTPKRESFFIQTTEATAEDSDVILGKGSYGVVYDAIYKMKKVAVKAISKEDEFKFNSLKRESNILTWRHPNIIRIFKIVHTLDYGAIIMEQFENSKPLQFILDNYHIQKVNLVHRLYILQDIANAIDYCHSHQVCHGDLKPLNVMVVVTNGKLRKYLCKLFDFGCSYKISSTDDTAEEIYSQNMLGTVRYCAPEMLQGGKVTTSIDIYSFGILMWQLKENEIPFASIKCNDVVIWQVVKNNLRPDSTILLLSELTEKMSSKEKLLRNHTSHQYCKSDLFDTLQVSPKLNHTPAKSFSANRKSNSRTEVMKKRDIKQEGGRFRNDKNRTRKNLFMENLKVVQDEVEFSSPNIFQNLFTDGDLRTHEKLFHTENRYIKLYKASWNEDPKMRPSTGEILNLLQEFLGCIEQ